MMICYVIILDTEIFNLFFPTYDILNPKFLLCIYVLPEDGSSWSKHVGEIITKNQIFVHRYL